jgi:hypothetical protein
MAAVRRMGRGRREGREREDEKDGYGAQQQTHLELPSEPGHIVVTRSAT